MNRNPNSRRGNRRGRRPRPNFRANVQRYGANTSTRTDNEIEKRVFTRSLYLNLLQSEGGDGTFQNYHLDDYLSRYTGTEYMTNSYDLYKYDVIEVFARVNMLHCSAQTDTIASQNAALNNTNIVSAIDTDTTVSLTSDEIFSYTNAKDQALGRVWRRVAKFRPHIRAADISLVGANPGARWLSSSKQDINHIGYQCHVYNTAGSEYFGLTNSTAQTVEFKIRSHVSFKGRRSTATNSTNALFMKNFIGSTITIQTPTPSTRTIDTYREIPDPTGADKPVFEFKWVGSAVWHPISILVSIIKNGVNLAGIPTTYDGPNIPARLYLTNWDAPEE